MKLKPWHVALIAIGAALLVEAARAMLAAEESPSVGEGAGSQREPAPRPYGASELIEEAREITRRAAAKRKVQP